MKIRDIVSLLRVHQWIKNLLIFSPPFFAGIFFDNIQMFFDEEKQAYTLGKNKQIYCRGDFAGLLGIFNFYFILFWNEFFTGFSALFTDGDCLFFVSSVSGNS
jgi:hypothetical protein